MGNPIREFFKADKVVWLVFVALLIFSALQVFSAISSLAYQRVSYMSPIRQHVMFLMMGVAVTLVILKLKWLSPRRNLFKILGYVGLLCSWILLVYVILFVEKKGGASRFIGVGGFTFQPSEIAKFCLIVVVADLLDAQNCFLARFLSMFKRYEFTFSAKQQFWTIMGLTFVSCGLIGLENLSTALLLGSVVVMMLSVSQIPIKWVLSLIGGAVVVLLLLYGISKLLPEVSDSQNAVVSTTVKLLHRTTTWTSRLDNFFSPDDENKFEVTDETRQVVHAQRAIARGGMLPSGPGTSIERDYLPNAYNDFIYAIVIEEYGLVGGCAVMFLFLLLFARIPAIAWKQRTAYASLLAYGAVFMIVLQAIINMMVSTNIGPVTGQPLPLVSKGGTSIIFVCAYFGVILNLSNVDNDNVVEEKLMNDDKVTILD